MSPIFWIVLAVFVITDLVVIAWVIRRFRANLFLPTAMDAHPGKVLAEAHEMVGEYLRANYSGDPAHLATALAGLLPRVRALAERDGINPRPEVIRVLIELSAARHGIATAQQIRQALASIDQAA